MFLRITTYLNYKLIYIKFFFYKDFGLNTFSGSSHLIPYDPMSMSSTSGASPSARSHKNSNNNDSQNDSEGNNNNNSDNNNNIYVV